MSAAEPFVPALRFHALTGLFDPFMSALMKEPTLRRRTLTILRPESGDRVLDLAVEVERLELRARVDAELRAVRDLRRLAVDRVVARRRRRDRRSGPRRVEAHHARDERPDQAPSIASHGSMFRDERLAVNLGYALRMRTSEEPVTYEEAVAIAAEIGSSLGGRQQRALEVLVRFATRGHRGSAPSVRALAAVGDAALGAQHFAKATHDLRSVSAKVAEVEADLAEGLAAVQRSTRAIREEHAPDPGDDEGRDP